MKHVDQNIKEIELIKRLTQVFSSVLFWFVLVSMSYAALLFENVFRFLFPSAYWWSAAYEIAFAFLTGGLISFFFYFLVVAVPERRKRRTIKANLQNLYAAIKRDIAYQIVFASMKGGRKDLSANSETIDRILTVKGFRELFKDGGESNEGFYAFRNHMSGEDIHEFQEIIYNLKALSKQIEYVLHNYTILGSEAFGFFKNLEMGLLRLEHNGSGYEEEKELSRFIWNIYGGTNWVKGPQDHDPVQKMIDSI